VAREVVIAVSSGTEQATPRRRGSVPMDDLARRKGVRPIELPLATLNVKDFEDFAEHDGLVLVTE
jgi:hypothetical protein